MLTVEQVVASQKANLDSLYNLTQQAFEGVEKLVDLNIKATRANLNESVEHAQAVLSAKDAQEFIALQSTLAQPLVEKAVSYNRHVYDIASGTSAELFKAFESKAAEFQNSIHSYVESSLKNAPAGSETAVAFFKQAMSVSNNAVESIQKAAKQAVEVAENNINAVTETAVKVAKAPAAKKRAA
jgi:phasin family protein